MACAGLCVVCVCRSVWCVYVAGWGGGVCRSVWCVGLCVVCVVGGWGWRV